jgi:aspartate racemase
MLGILGGMGPLATVDFFNKIVMHTPAKTDQEHMPIIIRNVPQVPDRSAAFLSGSDAPWEPLLAGVRMLESTGVQAIAIPCNTAHLWHARLAAATPVRILHIAHAAADWLAKTHPAARAAGILATAATVKSRLYHDAFEKRGLRVIEPTEDEQQWVSAGIHAVKAGEIAASRELMTRAAKALLARADAPQALLYGCTEVPIALAGVDFGVVPLDSSDTLALACVQWWQQACAGVRHAA